MDKIQLGQHAKALLEDELLVAIFESLANKYKTEFEKAERGDTGRMMLAHNSLYALKDVIKALHAHLGAARLYEADLAAAQKRREQKDVNNLHEY